MYNPPQRNYMSADAERIQMALLGIEPDVSERRVLGWVAYVLGLVALYVALIALGV
jgi:hypothetical protein